MAQGDLDLRIEEDLGVFDPLKEEFNKVQSGFKKAVETEVRQPQHEDRADYQRLP